MSAYATLRLCSDYLLVRPLPPAPDPSGLVHPYGRHAQTPTRALVLAAGPGYRTPHGMRIPQRIRVDDVVWLQFGAGTEVVLDGEALRMVPARDLFAVEGRADDRDAVETTEAEEDAAVADLMTAWGPV